MSAPLPPVPVVEPGTKPTTAWWITTVLGSLVPLMIGVAAVVPAPYSTILLAIAGALGSALGVSHTGIVSPPAPPEAPK